MSPQGHSSELIFFDRRCSEDISELRCERRIQPRSTVRDDSPWASARSYSLSSWRYAPRHVREISYGAYMTFIRSSGASFNNFLDALDGTYCTSQGGDDVTVDGSYPDATGYSGMDWNSKLEQLLLTVSFFQPRIAVRSTPQA